MPVYEYYCRTCDTKFEKLQPIKASADPVICPSGHDGALRTLSLIASVGNSDEPFVGGGCACGGNCSCV